jgi:hypothetical protein
MSSRDIIRGRWCYQLHVCCRRCSELQCLTGKCRHDEASRRLELQPGWKLGLSFTAETGPVGSKTESNCGMQKPHYSQWFSHALPAKDGHTELL